MTEAVLLDCDGVLLDSVEIKTEAFRHLFRQYPQHLEKIVKHHRDNGGMSRYEKFKFIYSELLKKPLSPQEMACLDREFNRFVYEKMLACPMFPGAEDFLKRWHRRADLYIVSGAPQEETRRILTERGLASYFRKISGSPTKKPIQVRRILQEEGISPADAVLVGDARQDAEAAAFNGVRFFAFRPDSDFSLFEGLPVAGRFSSWADLQKFLAEAQK